MVEVQTRCCSAHDAFSTISFPYFKSYGRWDYSAMHKRGCSDGVSSSTSSIAIQLELEYTVALPSYSRHESISSNKPLYDQIPALIFS